MIKKIIKYFEWNNYSLAQLKDKRRQYVTDSFTQYHLDILESINERVNLKDKVLADVGGSNIPAEVVHLFGVRKFVCIDPVTKWNSLHNSSISSRYMDKNVYKIESFNEAFEKEFSFILDEDIEQIKDKIHEFFDVVVSISTFEHVTSLDKTLSVIYQILKLGGILHSQYEPLFSCAVGHHVYIDADFNFNNMPEIEHMHLLCNKNEAELFLNKIKRFDLNLKKKIIEKAYDSKIINRFTLNDHIRSFQNSMFNKSEITYFCNQPVPHDRLRLLSLKYGEMRYDVRGIKYIAYK
jgi:hypothetical protein